MRLTLRTLLAYIDGVLDPATADELEIKIRESRIAQNAMRRIDEGISRKDLVTSATSRRANEQDPNVVAEYLDNTLDSDAIPLFEKSCFENDTQLVEVAAVHRILSVVLTKPAFVSDALRSRLKQMRGSYTLNDDDTDAGLHIDGKSADSEGGDSDRVSDSLPPFGTTTELANKKIRLDHPHREGSSSIDQALEMSTLAPAIVSPRTIPTGESALHGLDLSDDKTNSVPEYLRDHSTGKYSQYGIVAALIAALILVAWLSIGSFDQLRMLFAKPVPVADNGPVVEVQNVAPKQEVAVAALEPAIVNTAPPPIASEPPAQIAETPPIAVTNPIPDTKLLENPIEIATIAPPPAAVESTATVNVVPQPMENATGDIAIADVALPPGITPAETISTTPQPAVPAANDSPTSQISWQPETKDSAQAILIAVSSDANDQAAATKIHLLNVADVLPLADRLVVPDAYRTEVRVQPGLKWIIASATDMSGLAGSEKNIAYVDLRLGKALVHATTDCNTLVLHVADARYKVSMAAATDVVSVELKYFPNAGVPLQPGPDAIGPAYVLPVLSIGSVIGKAEIRKWDGTSWLNPSVCQPGQVVAWIADEAQPMMTLNEVPWWFRTSIERPIDSGAAADLALELQVVAPPSREVETNVASAVQPQEIDLLQTLKQATNIRRSETAALAARTLAMLGQYESIFGQTAILNQSSSRPHRDLIIDAVIQSMGLNIQRRSELQNILDAYDPPRGKQISAMMKLPDPKQLETSAGTQEFIDALSSPHLDERAIAIHQLKSITGKELTYQPDRVTGEALSQWRKFQVANKIQWGRYSVKPLPTP